MEVVARPHPLGVVEIAEELNMEPTRIHRFLRTLTHLGFVQQDKRRKYGPGPAVYCLAAQSLYASHFLQIALPPMERLQKAVTHIVALGVLWDRSVSYLYHASPKHRAIGSFGVWDAANSGIGMVLLAQRGDDEVRAIYSGHPIPNYPDGIDGLLSAIRGIRAAGYAFVSVASPASHWTLALPPPGNPFVGIGISGRITTDMMPPLLARMRETVRQIEELDFAYRHSQEERLGLRGQNSMMV